LHRNRIYKPQSKQHSSAITDDGNISVADEKHIELI